MTHHLHESDAASSENGAQDDETEGVSAAMSEQTLKMVVIILGVLLVLGFAIVVGTILYRLINLSDDTLATELPAQSSGAPALSNASAFGTLDVVRPAGMELKSFNVDGDRAYLHFTGQPGTEIIKIIRLPDGVVLGTIRLQDE